jgi:tellurite resistance protein
MGQPSDAREQRAHIPVSFFGMAVGSLAWGHAWRAASEIWPLPPLLPELAAGLGLAVWLYVLWAYARKVWEQAAAARLELEHPVMSAMAALGPVSTLLAAITLRPWWPQGAWALYAVAMPVQLALGLWLVGRLWQGGRPPESINASTYLPGVAQNLVAATASATFGYPALGALFFGAGVLSWLAMESLVLQRAATLASLPPAQRAVQGIQIAPAVVAGLGYVALTSGPPDLLAQMLLGYGLYQGLLAARLLRWTSAGGFGAGHWAFSFGVMAMATMALRLLQRAPEEPVWQGLAPALFALANAVMAVLAWRTMTLAWEKRLLPQTEQKTAPTQKA